MKKIYRGALIGCGYASWFQLTGWSRIDNAEIVAVSSRNQVSADKRASEFTIPVVYTDYREMLDQEDLDFVDIATPPIVHGGMVREAARRGLHVICQKPIAETMSELDSIIVDCRDNGVRFMVNENARFQPWFRKIKSIIEKGTIGTPFYAHFDCRARMSLPKLNFGGQPLLAEMPRMIIFELGTHYIDTLRYLFGEPESVYCTHRRVSPYIEGEDTAQTIVKTGGVDVMIDLSWASVPVTDRKGRISWGIYQVEGDKGTIRVDQKGHLKVFTDSGVTDEIQFPEDSEVIGYTEAQRHFVDCLETGIVFETSGEETAKTMEVVFGAYESSRSETVYRVGIDKERLD